MKRATKAVGWSHTDLAMYKGGQIEAEELVARLGERYRETGNPLCCWFALLACLQDGLPLPAFVSGYLLAVATDITRLAEMDDPGTYREPASYVPPSRETLRGNRESRTRAVIDALRIHPEGPGRRQDVFEAWCRPRREMMVELRRMARAIGLPSTESLEVVARAHGVKVETVINSAGSMGKRRSK